MVRSFDPRKPENIPPLVGLSKAAEMLGKKPANLRRRHDLPEPVEIEGVTRATPAWVRSEIEELARKLATDESQSRGR